MILAIFRKAIKAELPLRAAALAYHSLLALIPALVLVLWYFRYIGFTGQLYEKVVEYVYSQLSVDASETFVEYLDQIVGNVQSQSWGWIGLLIFVYTVANLVLKFGYCIDKVIAGGAPLKKKKTQEKLIIVAKRSFFLMGLPLSILVSIAVFTWIREDSLLRHVFEWSVVGPWIALPLPLLSSWSALFLLYKFTPSQKMSWGRVAWVALLVAVLLELAKFGMGLYSRYAFTNAKIYGTLAAIPVFILWVQLFWFLILIGALLLKVKHKKPKTQFGTT